MMCKKQYKMLLLHISPNMLYAEPKWDKNVPKCLPLPKDFSFFPYSFIRKHLFPSSVAPLCRSPPNHRRGADGVPSQQVGAPWSPVGLLLPIGYNCIWARLSAQSHLGRLQLLSQNLGFIYPVCHMPIYTERRGIILHMCKNMGVCAKTAPLVHESIVIYTVNATILILPNTYESSFYLMIG